MPQVPVTPEAASAPLTRFAITLDRLTTLDLGQRGVAGELHRWAVARQGDGRAFAAAAALAARVQPGHAVLIATGWPDRPHVTPLVAETDGPPGAALLGRGLHLALGAVPVFVVEADLVGAMAAVAEAAGLRALKPAEAVAAAQSRAPLHACAVIALATDLDTARAQATTMFDEFRPAAVIAIEKGGLNPTGHILTSRGDDTTDALAKVPSRSWLEFGVTWPPAE
ncbi:glutamate cyclase domain-containing protein [Elioraea sp.]|uniref:glutamate cyclase domain-containing protein n=1 Tax=Elioraea sp. TaxID=2185103 RepID=UPI00307EBF6F